MGVRFTRNDSYFYYCQYDPTTTYRIIDENGNETGETVPSYGEPQQYWANVSPAAGAAQFEQFGSMGNYDKVIVTRDMTCPINEQSVLFIDKEPEYIEIHTHKYEEGGSASEDEELVDVTYLLPKYDYLVKRVAKGLDAIAIQVRKVDVG